MKLRPTDETGDILPVLSSAEMSSGSEAVALLVKDRLNLLQGEWWENPSAGFPIFENLQSSRRTEADAGSISSIITAYIRETDGVQAVEEVKASVSGRQLQYTCTLITESGTAKITYEVNI